MTVVARPDGLTGQRPRSPPANSRPNTLLYDTSGIRREDCRLVVPAPGARRDEETKVKVSARVRQGASHPHARVQKGGGLLRQADGGVGQGTQGETPGTRERREEGGAGPQASGRERRPEEPPGPMAEERREERVEFRARFQGSRTPS